MKMTDRILVEVADAVPESRFVTLWGKLCEHFLEREDDDFIIFTTVRKFINWLEKTGNSLDDFAIYPDGKLVDNKEFKKLMKK